MSPDLWIAAVRAAGIGHLITVATAHFTPIPRNWDENLRGLPDVHRRFAVAQNAYIGAVMIFAGVLSLRFAPQFVAGNPLGRAVCAGIALWWGGRLLLLRWLHIRHELGSSFLRLAFAFLHVECAAFAIGYGWLAVR